MRRRKWARLPGRWPTPSTGSVYPRINSTSPLPLVILSRRGRPLFTETLTGAYSEVAGEIREVNKKRYRRNEAHAELGKALAELADKLEPIVTKAVRH